jgi:hypothetical protein
MNADWMQARIAELERANVDLVAERDEAMNMLADIEIAMNCVGSEMDKVVKETDAAVRERDAAVQETHRLLDQVANWQRAYDEMKRDRDEAEREHGANKDALADIEIAMNFAGNEMSKVMEERNAARAWSSAWKRAAKVKWIELCIQDDLLLFHQETIKAMRVALPGFVTPYPDVDARAADLEVRRMQCRPDLVPLDADPDADELAPFGWIPVPKPGQWQPGTTAGKDCRGNVGQGYAAQEREAHDA